MDNMTQTTEWLEKEIIELHFQVLRTQLLLSEIITKNNIQNLPSQVEMDVIEDRVLEVLNKKFPGIKIKRNDK